MRFKVSLKKNGKEFDEVVIANNKKEAMEAVSYTHLTLPTILRV